ncbi:MAG: FUN14 domain-containing protein [Planctomycetota bacterium]
MDRPASPPTKTTTQRSFGSWLRDMPRWKKIVLFAAVGTVAVGGVMSLVQSGSAPTGGSDAGGLTTSFAPGTGTGSIGQAGEEPAAKGIFRLGFSFLAGFCIGSFVRSALRIAAIAFGFWLVLTFALNYYGIVNVDWHAMDSLWNRFASSIESEWGSFQRFMTGSLPAAGLAVTGLAIGLKRH